MSSFGAIPKSCFNLISCVETLLSYNSWVACLAVPGAALGKDDKKTGSIGSLHGREEINKQGTHHQTHPRQQQCWNPSPAMSPALMTPADDSSAGTSGDAADDDAGTPAEQTSFPAALVTGTVPPLSNAQAGEQDHLGILLFLNSRKGCLLHIAVY